MKSIFPMYSINTGKILEGSLFKAHPYCMSNVASEKCRSFYDTIVKNNIQKLYTCPLGYSVLYMPEETSIICSLKIFGCYDISKVKKRQNSLFSPVLSSEVLCEYINKISHTYETFSLLKDSLHDVRKLNANIKASAEALSQRLSDDVKADLHRIVGNSALLTYNLDIFDFEANPNLDWLSKTTNIHLYKMFDKVIRCFKYEFDKRYIIIDMLGESNKKIKLSNNFSSVSYVLIDNALKYTRKGGCVDVIFEEIDKTLMLTIECEKSLYISKDEIELIFNKGYRGRASRTTKIDGQGKGMYFVKKLCEINNIDLNVTSDENTLEEVDGVQYANFRMVLTFKL